MPLQLFRIVTATEDDRFVLQLFHAAQAGRFEPAHFVAWMSLTRSQVPEVIAQAEREGIQEMPDHA